MAEDTNIVTTFHVEGKLRLHWDSKTRRISSLEMINALCSEDPVASSGHDVVTSGQGCSAFQSRDSSAIFKHGHVPKEHCTESQDSQSCCQDANGLYLFCKTAPITAAVSSDNCDPSKGTTLSQKRVIRQLDAKKNRESASASMPSSTETKRSISSYFMDILTKNMNGHEAGSSLSQNAIVQSAENEAVVELIDGVQSLDSISRQAKSKLSSLMEKLTRLISFENKHQQQDVNFLDRKSIYDLNAASISSPHEDKIYCIKENDSCTSLPATDLQQGTNKSFTGSRGASMDTEYTVWQSHCVSTPPVQNDIVETENHSMDITNSFASETSRNMVSEHANSTRCDMPSIFRTSADSAHVDVNSINKAHTDRSLSNASLMHSEKSALTVCPQQNKISLKRSRENIKPFEKVSSTLQTAFCDKVVTESGQMVNTVLLNDRKTSTVRSRWRKTKSKKMPAVKGELQLHSGNLSRQQSHESIKKIPAIGLLYQGEKKGPLPSRKITRQYTRRTGRNSINSLIEEDKSKELRLQSALRCVKRKKNARMTDAGSSRNILFPEDTNASFPDRQQKRRHICLRSCRKSGHPIMKVVEEVQNSLQARGIHRVRRHSCHKGRFSRNKWKKAFQKSSSISQCPRPRNSFIFFSIKKRARLVASQPQLKFGEISKLLGEMWMNMSNRNKEPYRILAQKDAKRYYIKATSLRKRH